MNAVEISRLVFDYPAQSDMAARRALDIETLSVAQGELFGLLGPNGSGKSTLFRILATSFPPLSGKINLMGVDLLGNPASARPLLGVAFQNPSLDLKLTVNENLVHGGRLYGLHGSKLAARIDELLNRYRLTDRGGDRCAALSGGLRRRVELAKSLLHDPKVLLLDEPSTGLDPAARADLWEHLLALKSTGTTILVTTHLMEEGDRCDRVAILDRGHIVANGTPSALKAEIGGDVVTVETENPGPLAADIEAKFSIKPSLFNQTLRLELKNGHAFIPQLVEAFPGRLKAVSLARPSLEDAFLHHAGRRFSDAEAAS